MEYWINNFAGVTGKLVLVVVAAVPRIIWKTRNDGVSGTHRKNRWMMCCCDQTNWILDSLLVVFVEKGGQNISIAWGVSLFEQVANEVFGAVQGQKPTHVRLSVFGSIQRLFSRAISRNLGPRAETKMWPKISNNSHNIRINMRKAYCHFII
mgnify:CR=1 FL=1